MRGTLRRGNDKGHADGIIPAHAGNTGAPANDARAAWDHPRACGEHTSTGTAKVTVKGSSPRMRGTLDDTYTKLPIAGIIPAHAGNTNFFCFLFIVCRDHPRACGEHCFGMACVRFHSGSSPRMRGTRRHATALRRIDGIIPAHAGNTCRGYRRYRTWWDHPRACGEHSIIL